MLSTKTRFFKRLLVMISLFLHTLHAKMITLLGILSCQIFCHSMEGILSCQTNYIIECMVKAHDSHVPAWFDFLKKNSISNVLLEKRSLFTLRYGHHISLCFVPLFSPYHPPMQYDIFGSRNGQMIKLGKQLTPLFFVFGPTIIED